MVTGGEAITRSLIEEGVDTVFGLPGTHVLGLYAALHDYRDRIKHVLGRFEPSMGFMADGYARASGKVGVVIATAGPGATGLVTPLAQASVEGVPIVALVGLTPIRTAGRGYYHEFRDVNAQLSIFKPFTKLAVRVEDPREIPRVMAKAFRTAKEGRPGPVYVELPRDVIESETEWMGYTKEEPIRTKPDPSLVELAAKELLNAERPIIYVGGGVIAANASDALIKVAEELGAPVVTSIMGKGAIPFDHPLHGGLAAGYFGDTVAVKLVEKADVVLAIGTRFSELGTGMWSLPIRGRLIHVNIDPNDIGRNYKTDLSIVSDALEFLNALYDKVRSKGPGRDRGIKLINEVKASVGNQQLRELGYDESRINPSDLVRALAHVLDNDMREGKAIVTCDAGGNQVAMFELPVYKPRTYFNPAGFTSLGFAIPAAIGAKIARPEATVVATTGDAAFFMTGMEIATAAELNLKVAFVIFNDRAQGVLKLQQRFLYGGKVYASHTYPMDFCKFAESLNVGCVRISDRRELEPGLERCIYKSGGPCIADVLVNPDAVPIPITRQLMAIFGRRR
ncbi:thiamine pyrophosphate-binding protein [Vulcanisaeta distributa]|uniref:2-oxoacid oxidoreductase (ferredoxin) n=1 Tax=Vulcanisaeta distributa (strain DSM 14429 / JCM 11212 / NBRC 100878 / IC-017) TaxID=572478 RepID=E1QT78_VULDI|nr:thiamine pyrophosphate-binding protein [Vulcanisaeta distributa]ADN49670.1 thiamine pyrophosphate protein central region [Vulcanisaeta distributa DSM 14429]